MKVMTVRISDELATEVAVVARAEEVPVSEAVRAALHHYVASCRSDPDFQVRLQERLEEDRDAMERLASRREGGSRGN